MICDFFVYMDMVIVGHCLHLLQVVSKWRNRKMLVEELVNTKEAARLLRVSYWTVSAWLSQGKLPRVKAGRRTLIAKSDLEAFLRRNKKDGRSKNADCSGD